MIRSSFFDDPFFTGQDQMDQMFPFGRDMNSMMALPSNHGGANRRRQQQAQNMQVADRGLFMDPFAQFDSMFSNMHSMMADMRNAFATGGTMTNGNGPMFQQSSFMSYSNTGNGTPKYYQASSSSRRGPNGLMETQKTERNSETGIHKIAVGHHIRDRGHVVERSKNSRTGEMNENKDYINLDEGEAEQFEREYKDTWQAHARGVGHTSRQVRSPHGVGPSRTRYAALPESEHRRPNKRTHWKE